MTKLVVSLHNCSRPKHERVLLEETFKETLLNLCPNPDSLLKLKQQWQHSNPKQRWLYDYPRLYKLAFSNAAINKQPKEYNQWRFEIEWTP